MVFQNLLRKARPVARQIHTTPVTNSGGSIRGVIGSNLPFPIENRYVLLGIFCGFFGSGLALPFLILRNALIKRSRT